MWFFLILAYSTNCCLIKSDLFDCKQKWTIFGIYNEFLSTKNVNVASFARNVEWDIFCDFQTL